MDRDILRANLCELIGEGGAHTVRSLWTAFSAETRRQTSKEEIQQALRELAEEGVLRQERSLEGGWFWSWANDDARDTRLLRDLRQALGDLDCGSHICVFPRKNGLLENGPCYYAQDAKHVLAVQKVHQILREIGGSRTISPRDGSEGR